MAADIYEKEHILSLEGGPVCVYESGSENLLPVILLHGAMYDEARLIWHHLAPALAKTRHVYAVDFPRHGKSRPWTGTIGQERLVEIVKEVTAYFNLPPLPLIGLSMGGGVAIGFALKYPDQVTGGIFMGPGGLGDKVANQLFSWLYVKTPGALMALTRFYGKATPAKLRKSMANICETRENTRDLDDLTAVLHDEAQGKWKYREKAMDDWQNEGLAPFRLKINLLPEVHRLNFPTLWLRGREDPLVGQAVMEEAAKLSPKGTLRVVEHAGHMLPLEQPEEVCRIVEQFLLENGI